MATASGDQVKAVKQNWVPVGKALDDCVAMKQSLLSIEELNGEKSDLQDKFDGLSIDKIKALEKKADALKVAKTSEEDYNELRDSLRKLGPPFVKSVNALKDKVALALKDARDNGWRHKVVGTDGKPANLKGYDKTLLNKLKEIVEENGRGDHGDTQLGGSHGRCLHWRLGDERIFGSMKNGKFVFVGTGRHSGKGNSNYKVDLEAGGSTTATTA